MNLPALEAMEGHCVCIRAIVMKYQMGHDMDCSCEDCMVLFHVVQLERFFEEYGRQLKERIANESKAKKENATTPRAEQKRERGGHDICG